MKKADVIKVSKHALFLVVLYILQAMVFPRLKIQNTAPVLLPIAAVGVALFEGPRWGAGFGLAAGILCDLSFSSSPGLFTVFLAACGLLVGLMSDVILARGFPSYLIVSIAVLILTAILQMFSFLVFERVAVAPLTETALRQTLYSTLFILPIYFPSKRLRRKVKA